MISPRFKASIKFISHEKESRICGKLREADRHPVYSGFVNEERVGEKRNLCFVR